MHLLHRLELLGAIAEMLRQVRQILHLILPILLPSPVDLQELTQINAIVGEIIPVTIIWEPLPILLIPNVLPRKSRRFEYRPFDAVATPQSSGDTTYVPIITTSVPLVAISGWVMKNVDKKFRCLQLSLL